MGMNTPRKTQSSNQEGEPAESVKTNDNEDTTISGIRRNYLIPALSKAMAEMGPLHKNATNPHFKNSYADLNEVLETIRDPLHDAGILWMQAIDTINDRPALTTTLTHVDSGDSMTSIAPIMCKDPDNPQSFGGAVTYMRRFSLVTLFGLGAVDDDGNRAARKPAPPQETVNQQTGEIRATSQMEDLSQTIVIDASDRDGKGTATQEQRNRMFAIAKSDDLQMTDTEIKALLMEAYGTESTREISFNQMVEFTKTLDKMQQQARKARNNVQQG